MKLFFTFVKSFLLLQVPVLWTILFLPVQISGQVITGGAYHTITIASDGTLRSWGYDSDGALGDDVIIQNKNTPVSVATLTGITAVAGVGQHSLALKNNGTVWSWGYDCYGQLGDDVTLASKSTPVAVATVSNVTAIAAGYYNGYALKNDGTVWSWGYDNNGQLGDDIALTDQATPVAVATISSITKLAGGFYHALALKSDGTVWSWGDDANGQLGDDLASADQATPVQVSGLTNITAISAGWFHSMALKNDGTVWAWGSDGFGQLGDDVALVNQNTPVQVSGLTNIVAIAGGAYHSLALKSDGTVWSWGWDSFFGQLGDDAPMVDQAVPVQVSGLTNIRSISAGYAHSLAVTNDGSQIYAWGYNAWGQLGNGNNFDQTTPVLVSTGGSFLVLPVKLREFYGTCIANPANNNNQQQPLIHLFWTTESEQNNNYFSVERSFNGIDFEPAQNNVKGAGNSSTTKHYSLTDQPFENHNSEIMEETVYYRLKQVDFNGQYEYFNPVTINICQSEKVLSKLLVFPTFIDESVTNTNIIYHSGSVFDEVLFSITDITGKIVFESVVESDQDNIAMLYTDFFKSVKPGVYSVICSGKNTLHNQRIIVK